MHLDVDISVQLVLGQYVNRILIPGIFIYPKPIQERDASKLR